MNDIAISQEPTRISKKRERTRAALIRAARELVFERGHDKIAIQDITDRADVGLGTFYNYFETKHNVFEAVLDDLREEFNRDLEEIRRPLKDPTLILAISLKFGFREARENDTWKTFLEYAGLTGEHHLHQDEAQCRSDIERGARAGRFKVEDPHFACDMVLAIVRHVNREIEAGRLGTEAMIDATRYILRMLGLPDVVAQALAQTSLPPRARTAQDREITARTA